jgi:hypothetical protein
MLHTWQNLLHSVLELNAGRHSVLKPVGHPHTTPCAYTTTSASQTSAVSVTNGHEVVDTQTVTVTQCVHHQVTGMPCSTRKPLMQPSLIAQDAPAQSKAWAPPGPNTTLGPRVLALTGQSVTLPQGAALYAHKTAWHTRFGTTTQTQEAHLWHNFHNMCYPISCQWHQATSWKTQRDASGASGAPTPSIKHIHPFHTHSDNQI